MWLIKIINYSININDIKRQNPRSNDKVHSFKDFKKQFGKKIVDYLAPTYFNSMPLNLKTNVGLNNIFNVKKHKLDFFKFLL